MLKTITNSKTLYGPHRCHRCGGFLSRIVDARQRLKKRSQAYICCVPSSNSSVTSDDTDIIEETSDRTSSELTVLRSRFPTFPTSPDLIHHLSMPQELDNAEERVFVAAQKAHKFVSAVLQGNGVPHSNAEIIAKCLIAADLRGVDTHGMNRIPSYMERVRQGVLDPAATPSLKQITPVVAQVNGNNAFGFLGASLGMEAAINSAKVFGIGMASIKHSNHFGMSAWLVQQALAADPPMLSLVFTNSSPALPVWGGQEKMLGVSPIACGAPGPKGSGKDFILDMAPSIAARGKIYKALRRGESIPTGWALDKEGRETTDPAAALDGGVMLPMGGPKGSALAIMMDVFSGVLSGSAFAGGVTNPYDPSKPADVGHFLVVIRPDLFLGDNEDSQSVGSESGLEQFRKRMEVLYDKVVGSKRAAGVDRIFFPGELEILEEQKRLNTGIPLVQAELDALNREAKRVGVEQLLVIE